MHLRKRDKRNNGTSSLAYEVIVNSKEISCVRSDGHRETVHWNALQAVILEAVDSFPIGNVYWLLVGPNKTGCLIPMGATGDRKLLNSMQERLPNFDNEGVIKAMGMLDGRIIVWTRDNSVTHNQSLQATQKTRA